MQELYLHSERIYTSSGCISGYLHLKDGCIKDIFKDSSCLKKHIECKEYGRHRIIPGIIDIHSHGYRSWPAKTIHKEDIQGLSKMLPSIGVTSTYATITGWKEKEMEMLDVIANAIEEGCTGANIMGIHMEGPFFHPKRHNATPLRELQTPNIDVINSFLKAGRGHVRYMTLAPELDGCMELISYLTSQGVIVGAGHTTANYDTFLKAKNAGIKVSIHTGNAMNQMDRREVSLMGGALLDKDIYCEIICDFFHVSKEMIDIMLRNKQDDHKIIMISDSDIISGMEPGYYHAYHQNIRVHEDGRILLDDGTIDGSSKNVLYGIYNLVEKLKLPMETVLLFSSLNPAVLHGIDDRKGSIEINKDGDIVIIDDDYQVVDTYVNGSCVYHKGSCMELNPRFDEECVRIDEEEM